MSTTQIIILTYLGVGVLFGLGARSAISGSREMKQLADTIGPGTADVMFFMAIFAWPLSVVGAFLIAMNQGKE